MAGRLADLIQEERRRQFVGREEELSSFADAIASPSSEIAVIHVQGPGGVGKTTLLRQFESLCRANDVRFVTIDARNIQPTPESLMFAFATSTGSADFETAFDSLAASERSVLFIDTYEAIESLDGWLREQFLPRLPSNVLVVLLGRKRPGPAWRSDVWQRLSRTISLRNLGDVDVSLYLAAFDVPARDHASIIRFTHGYPLALSLVAENYAQRGDVGFLDESSPDVLELLLDRFLEGVTDKRKREALELCALVRHTSESLLNAVFGAPAQELTETPLGSVTPSGLANETMFSWLRGLSFIEETPFGLMPHDLARETIVNELRWRNLDRYSDLHHRARAYYADRMDRASGALQHLILFDYIYLHRDSPMVQPFFDWNAGRGAFVDSARDQDTGEILEMVQRHEGSESRAIAEYWLRRQPENFLVLRDSAGGGRLKGILVRVAIDGNESEGASIDPALRAAESVLKHAPLREGERAIHFRFWMAHDQYQEVGPVQSVIFVAIVQHIFADPSMALTFLSFSKPDFWAPMFNYAMYRRAPEADFEVGGIRYGIFAVDWRAMPPKVWLDRLGAQEAPIKAEREPRRASTELVVLSREGFEQSVAEALKSFTHAGKLSENPLLASRVVIERVGSEADTKAKVQGLRALIVEAAKTLNSNPKDSKLFHAIDAGYLRPERSQEVAAEKVDVAIATFRRHLKSGISRLTELLWQQETGI